MERIIVKRSLNLVFYGLWALALFLSGQLVWGDQLAITLDDAPMGDMEIYSGKERTDRIIEALNRFKLKVALFSNSSNFDRFDGIERMKKYDLAGHMIANHTHSHPRLNELSAQEFINDIDQGYQHLKKLQ
jgi:peptidoglycan/xylan/chitin deacetylase (PgdA/CDA1 family)